MPIPTRVCDALAPFFSPLWKEERRNWSKIPFYQLEKSGCLTADGIRKILKDFEIYCSRASAAGYNALSLDDIAHAAMLPEYPEDLNARIRQWRTLYEAAIAIAERHGLGIYFTTDVMFYHPRLKKMAYQNDMMAFDILRALMENVIRSFPAIKGIIVRLGEGDGLDVRGDFLSRVEVKTASQARNLIDVLLPAFVRRNKSLVVRTWSVGAHPVGDLIWNEKTFDKVFGGITDNELIISQKPGPSDFFRKLEFSPVLARSGRRLWVEVQARREYEGFGEFAHYAGREYERLRSHLKDTNIDGLYVFAQMGGWSHFRRLTFLDSNSIWNNLNASAAIDIMHGGMTAQKAARRFAKKNLPAADPDSFAEICRLSDRALRKGWYLPEISRQPYYFRRSRLPPLFWVFWDRILILDTLRPFLRHIVRNRRKAIEQSRSALEDVKRMKKLSEESGLPENSIRFMKDSFEMIYLGRLWYFGKRSRLLEKKISEAVDLYRKTWNSGFKVELDLHPQIQPSKWLVRLLFRLFIRNRPQYSFIEKWFWLKLSGLTLRLMMKTAGNKMPSLSQQAMGLDFIFR